MKKKRAAPVFKPYVMNQVALLPPSYEELIPFDHLVRVVNEAVEKVDVSALIAQYKGGGTSSYHPKMLLKVLVYAYAERIYSSRRIAKGLRENIYFMWISGGNRPDFRTINAFRGSRMKGVIEEVFTGVLEYLVGLGQVKLEHYYLDGTKMEADANKHKVVWAKRRENYQRRVKEQIQELLKHIEEVNAEEQEEYGDEDLEEMGGSGKKDVNSEELKRKIEEINQKLRERIQPKKDTRAVRQALKKLEGDCLVRLEKYEQQEKMLAGRTSYSQTDPDASCMRMKEDRGAEKPWPKPAYNVQIGTEGQFVVGFSVHTHAGDTNCLIPHLETAADAPGPLTRKDRGGCRLWQRRELCLSGEAPGGQLSSSTTLSIRIPTITANPKSCAQHQFRVENFGYDADKDEFICPAQQRLRFQYTSRYTTDNGYITHRRYYQCDQCQGCPLKPQCTHAKDNRKIQVSFRLLEYRRQARALLTTEQGQRLRAQRSIEVETVFGNIKHNLGFRRFHLRGLEKVKTEWGLVSIAHNMRKLAG